MNFMMIYEELNPVDKLTDEQIAMLKKLEESPIVFDEDCPEYTYEQLAEFAEAARKRRKEQANL
ncbi:MAG: hypothetical protein NC078_09555 [Ruminococcus sp.]|nr:hypothetical protein [Ruminococcus sp.]